VGVLQIASPSIIDYVTYFLRSVAAGGDPFELLGTRWFDIGMASGSKAEGCTGVDKRAC
jgi:hypothetical protein